MKDLRFKVRYVFVLLLVLTGLGLCGCASPETENLSERPWDSPKGWDTGGLPSNMNEGR